MLGKPQEEANLIICHLGGCVDTLPSGSSPWEVLARGSHPT